MEILEFHEDDEEALEPLERLDQFQLRLKNKEHKKRSVSKMTLEIAGGTKVGFRFYSLLKKFTKPSGITIDRRTGERLKSYLRQLCIDTGQELKPEDLGGADETTFWTSGSKRFF